MRDVLFKYDLGVDFDLRISSRQISYSNRSHQVQRPVRAVRTVNLVPWVSGNARPLVSARSINFGVSSTLAFHGLVNNPTIRVYIIPLFGAYVADTRWGRYKTICVSVAITLLGHILLIVSAIPPVIVNSKGSTACFIIALIIMGVGTGGFKSNISPLVAEQYRRSKMFVETTSNGERVIVDPMLTISRIYMVSRLSSLLGGEQELVSCLTSTFTCSSTSELLLDKSA